VVAPAANGQGCHLAGAIELDVVAQRAEEPSVGLQAQDGAVRTDPGGRDEREVPPLRPDVHEGHARLQDLADQQRLGGLPAAGEGRARYDVGGVADEGEAAELARQAGHEARRQNAAKRIRRSKAAPGKAPDQRDKRPEGQGQRPDHRPHYTRPSGMLRAVGSGLEDRFQTLHEIVKAARTTLAPGPWDYLVGATETETTLRRNRLAIDSLALRPRVLRDVSKVDATSTFLGKPVRIPVMMAPIGSIESFTPGGGATAAQASAEFGVPQMLSSVCNPGLEAVAKAADNFRIFQLYVRGDDSFVDDHVHRAVANGYTGFCMTVDTASYSRRERDLARRFVKPWRLRATGFDYQAGPQLEQRQALQGHAPERAADPQGHRHGGGCRDRRRARGGRRLRLQSRRTSARPGARLARRAAGGRARRSAAARGSSWTAAFSGGPTS
jgi:hypothetical protein